MQFSVFQNSLNTWQGTSILIGVFKEDIPSQLNSIGFLLDIKLLMKKIKSRKFNLNKNQNQIK